MKLETWNYDKASPPRQELVLVDNDRVVARLECDFVGDNPYTVPKEQAVKYGALFQSAPDLLAALQEADKLCGLAVKYFPKSINNGDTFTLLNVRANSIRAAIAKATGVQQ